MRLLPADLHRSERPSLTARATLLMRVGELERPPADRIVSDDLAPVFAGPVTRGAVRATGPVRRVVEQWPVLALTTSVLCRHAYLDACVLADLEDTEQVVILGAGYDTRAHRFASQLGERPVFEVDLPPLSRRKAAIVEAHPDRFGAHDLRRVEIDFRTDDLRERLGSAGFRSGTRTVVIWEGVVPYLTRAAAAATFADLAAICGPGSRLAFDTWASLDGPGLWPRVRRAAEQSLSLIGEPAELMVPVAEVVALAGEPWQAAEIVPARAVEARFSTGGRPCDPGMTLVTLRRD